MPSIYARELTKTLAESIAALQAEPPAKQLQIFDELALMRDVAAQAIMQYGVAREAAASQPENMKLQGMVLETGAVMRDHLNDVVKLAETAGRIEQQAKDKISIPQLHYFVDQLIGAIYTALDGDVYTAKQIEKAIKNQVLLPSIGSSSEKGTLLTPDMDVTAMDEMVPKVTDVT